MKANPTKAPVLMGIAFALFFGAISESRATITPLDASDILKYALVTDLSHGGNFNVNNTQVNGNTAVLGASGASGANNDLFNGNFSYTGSSFSLYNTVTVNGTKSQDFTLAGTVQKAADFSRTMAGFAATQTFGQIDNVQTLTGNGGVNVVDITAGNVNGTVTLKGGANDLFYINVGANMAMSGVVLSGGVTANHVFWNIINGQNANLSGTLNGTFLAFNSNSQATLINVNQATVNGSIYSGGLDANELHINGLAVGNPGLAMAPEASSMAGMALFACFLLGSSLKGIMKSAGGMRIANQLNQTAN
jgi:hypothetical protein